MKLNTLLKMTAQARRQGVTIQRRLTLYLLTLILMFLGALILILSIMGFFSDQSQNFNESLRLQLKNAEVRINQHRESLEAQAITLSQQISKELNTRLTVNGLSVADLNDNPELLLSLQEALFVRLNTTLQLSECSGAYLILDVTTNTTAVSASHSASGIYLRYANFNAKGAARQDVVLFRGIPQIARDEQLQLHNRWNLEFDTDLFPGFQIVMASSVERLADGCRWSHRFRLPDTWEDVTILYVPVLTSDGSVCGICGVELSSLYSYLSYPKLDTRYGPMVTVLSPVSEEWMYVGKGVTGCLDETFLGEEETLRIQPGHYYNTYFGENDTYLGIHTDSTAMGVDGRMMAVAVLVPESTYLSYISKTQSKWIFSSLIFVLLMVVLSVVLSRRFARPITTTLRAIQSEVDLGNSATGISELDELMKFVASKSEAQLRATGGLPADVEELFASFAQRAKTLTAAERGILKYYIEGYEITEIPDLAFVSIHTVKKHNSNIYQKLGVASRDELMLYIELFRRCGRLNELTEQG